jgi:hypothetical protein
MRRPSPGIASNVTPRGRLRHRSFGKQILPRQCGRSSKPRACSHPCEVIPTLGCMRSSRGANGRRAECQSCAKTVPLRPQAAPGMAWECGSLENEQRLRTWPPRHLQLLWGGGGRSTGGLGGKARTPRGALRSAVEIAPALARCLSVPQCSAGHVRPASGEMGARCSRVFGTAAAAGYSSSAFHRASRYLQRAHCARPLDWGNKPPEARSEAAAHCGNPGKGVPRARSLPRVTAALLVRRRQAHRGSGAPLLFATTGRVPREQLRAHQWRRKQRTEWTKCGRWARMLVTAAPSRFFSSLRFSILRSRWGHTTSSMIAIHSLASRVSRGPISARFGGRPEYSAQNDASRGAPTMPATVAHWVRIAR